MQAIGIEKFCTQSLQSYGNDVYNVWELTWCLYITIKFSTKLRFTEVSVLFLLKKLKRRIKVGVVSTNCKMHWSFWYAIAR